MTNPAVESKLKSEVHSQEDWPEPITFVPSSELRDDEGRLSWNRWFERTNEKRANPVAVFPGSGGWDFPRDHTVTAADVAAIIRNYEREKERLLKPEMYGHIGRLLRSLLDRAMTDRVITELDSEAPDVEVSTVSKSPPNSGKQWTPEQDAQLKAEAAGNTPTRVIALHLGRSEEAVQSHASELGISLKPTNQSPYGTRKKS